MFTEKLDKHTKYYECLQSALTDKSKREYVILGQSQAKFNIFLIVYLPLIVIVDIFIHSRRYKILPAQILFHIWR